MTEHVSSTFQMPSCMWKHHTHKWWCKRCRRMVEEQFRDVCECWWSVPRDVSSEILRARRKAK